MTNPNLPTIKRDRWDRPLLIPADGSARRPYTRVSTLAKALDDLTQLMKWKQRKTAEGILRRQDLLTRISGALANGDPDTDWPTKRDLNEICEEAIQAAGASRGSSAGTGFHAISEAIDRGEEPIVVDADRPRVEAYREALIGSGYAPLDIECFVANDVVWSAGTFDRLWRCPDGAVRVGDLKTGKSEADYPFATALQLAIYANAERYDPADDSRSALHADLDLATGLLVHMPPSGGCRVIPLDIELGWTAAKVAAEAHRLRSLKPASIIRASA